MRRLLCLLSLWVGSHAWGGERFALIIGNNQGEAGRARLWFAERDAERVAHTLEELGEFPESHVVLLEGKGLAEIEKSIQRVEEDIQRSRAAGSRALLLIYFSGHASRAGLELGDEHVSYDDLRGWLARSPATVKVAIVDACGSGELTQVKGARPAPEVDFPLPSDDSTEGTAFIASTAAGELAQESAGLGGSFFTHYFEMALRGAGDADGDGNVTLGEAFRYTAAQTISGTLTTEAGPQHPTYQVRMAGRGDLVLAQLRHADARLILPAAPGAVFFLSGPAGFRAEIPGVESLQPLGVPAGHYAVERRRGALRDVAELTLKTGEERTLPVLVAARTDASGQKGGTELGIEPFVGALGVTGVLTNSGILPGARAGVRIPIGPRLRLRFQVDWAGRQITDQRLVYDLDLVSGSAAVLFSVLDRWVRLDVGGELGYQRAFQKLLIGPTEGSNVGFAGLAVGVSIPVAMFRLGLDVGVDAQVLSIDGVARVRASGNAALVLGLRL